MGAPLRKLGCNDGEITGWQYLAAMAAGREAGTYRNFGADILTDRQAANPLDRENRTALKREPRTTVEQKGRDVCVSVCVHTSR